MTVAEAAFCGFIFGGLAGHYVSKGSIPVAIMGGILGGIGGVALRTLANVCKKEETKKMPAATINWDISPSSSNQQKHLKEKIGEVIDSSSAHLADRSKRLANRAIDLSSS